MFHIVLVEPEIPQNTGNIVRTAAATGCTLHLIKPLGFEISDKYLKRAGLDYWDKLTIVVHENLNEFFKATQGGTYYFLSSKGPRTYTEVEYKENDYLLFGKETKGISEDVLNEHYESCVRIPMREGIRCLNLSNAVAIVVYEGLRQLDFPHFKLEGKLKR